MSRVEYRKLIKFGESSHVISIPKNWMEKNNLKKGDVVYFSENGNNELIIAPQMKEEEKEDRKIIINADNKDMRKIAREIISAYLNDFGTVVIEGKEVGKLAPKIRERVQNLMAFEIIEQSNHSVVTKDFLNMKDISIDNLMRRMDIIAKAMFSDVKTAKDKDDLIVIEGKEQDMNKLSFVILRAVRNGLKNPSYMKTLDTSALDIFQRWSIANQIETIADHIKRVAEMLVNFKIEKKEKERILKIIDDIEVQYTKTVTAYYTNDTELAFEATNKKTAIWDECNAMVEEHLKNTEPKNGIPAITERLKNLTKEVNVIARRVYS